MIDKKKLNKAVRILATIDNRVTGAILREIHKNEVMTPTDLMFKLRIDHSPISQALMRLKRYNLVEYVRSGRNFCYHVNYQEIERIKTILSNNSNEAQPTT